MDSNHTQSEQASSHASSLATDESPIGSNAEAWSIEDSEELYRINEWGAPYFSINAAGHVVVSPQGQRGGSLDLWELVDALKKRNLSLPILIRFPDILQDRIDRLNAAFARAIARYNYAGSYRGVYPVKVNQQKHIVESIVDYGQPYKYGLEAGSKPELLIALSELKTPGALLICNGYKDSEYIETAILAQRLGKNVIIVLEQLDEVHMAVAIAQRLNAQPQFGLRCQLSQRGQGHWGSTTGERAKFGLDTIQMVEAVQLLEQAELLDGVRLLHFHVGSQISSISVLKGALREAGRIYAELVKMGAQMGYLDVGGGLAVDYSGSRSSHYASKNYNTQSYANDVVAELNDACTIAGVPVPTIISESGRAVASHQSVLVFDVLGANVVSSHEPPKPDNQAHHILKTLYEIYQDIDISNCQESYNDVIQFKGEASTAFQHGILSLQQRAQAERLYWASCMRIRQLSSQCEEVSPELQQLDKVLSAIYYVNISVFQSAPDAWAIEQLFPIMPIHRLDEKPTERAALADLTCDSDGKVTKFISGQEDVKPLLEVHPLQAIEDSKGGPCARFCHKPYYLGMFLSGAYQETMGNLHNLFGDTNAVHIRLTPQGYQVQHIVRGDTMGEVLGYVQYNVPEMLENLRQQCESAMAEGLISLEESQMLQDNLQTSLSHYTYLS